MASIFCPSSRSAFSCTSCMSRIWCALSCAAAPALGATARGVHDSHLGCVTDRIWRLSTARHDISSSPKVGCTIAGSRIFVT
jgi:hypothetical protein